jgi:hypothetical protein
MIHDVSAVGVTLVEASGDVKIGGVDLCTISTGRAILASDDGLSLIESKRIRIAVTEPTTIQFNRSIKRCEVIEEGVDVPVSILTPNSQTLDIDSELSRYILLVVI